jgi:hypothetical protein
MLNRYLMDIEVTPLVPLAHNEDLYNASFVGKLSN